MTRVERLLTLAAWLGPLAPPHGRPQNVRRRALREQVDDGVVQSWVYEPSVEVSRHLFVVPGVHYDGPSDPRLDRFARILASSGARVCVPFLRDFMRLQVTPRVERDAIASWRSYRRTVPELRAGNAGVVSLSFGSLPAARVATSEEFSADFDLFVPFGGYADFDAALRFALTGEDGGRPPRPHDPLNRPVAFATLIEEMEFADLDVAELRRRWLRYARQTWGRPEMKLGQRYVGVARAEAAALSGLAREVFLLGCGAVDGGVEVCQTALQRVDLAFTDPFAHAERLRSRVLVVHGRDDDVIPPSQADAIRERVEGTVAVEVCLTGLYGHTGSSRPSARAIGRELATLWRVLGGFADAGVVRAGR